MKNTLFLLIAICTLASCGGDKPASDDVQETIEPFSLPEIQTVYETYSNDNFGYELQYPKTWDTTRRHPAISFMAEEGFKDSTDKFSEGFNLLVYKHQGQSLDQIADENKTAAEGHYEDVEVFIDSITTDNDLQCRILNMAMQQEDLFLDNRSAFFTNDEYAFTLTYSSETHKTDDYQEIFDHIINSFVLK